MINVLYFARIAELTGKRTEQLGLAAPQTVEQWLAQLNTSYPALQELKVLKVAVNKKHARPDTLLQDGDEVAIFEPVTGG